MHQGSFITFIPLDTVGVSFLSSCISGIPLHGMASGVLHSSPHQELGISLRSPSPVHSPLTLWNLRKKSQ